MENKFIMKGYVKSSKKDIFCAVLNENHLLRISFDYGKVYKLIEKYIKDHKLNII